MKENTFVFYLTSKQYNNNINENDGVKIRMNFFHVSTETLQFSNIEILSIFDSLPAYQRRVIIKVGSSL